MAAFIATLLLTVTTVLPAGQVAVSGESPDDLQIVETKWKSFFYRPGWDAVAYTEPSLKTVGGRLNKQQQEQRKQEEVEKPNFFQYGEASWRRIQMYEYSVKVKNVGKKTIKAIDYDYLFIDPTDQSVVAAHAFRSYEKIKPGTQRKLVQETRNPPTVVVDAGTVTTAGTANPFKQDIRIMRIYYTDGTVWRRKV